MDKEDERRFWLALVLGLLLARALRALFSTLFYESLATFRLNHTAWWMLVLLAPAISPLVRGRGLPIVVALAGAATSLLPLTRFGPWHVPAAALATAAGLVALARVAGIAGALAGLTLDGAILVLGASLEPSSILLPIGLAIAALALALRARAPAPPAAAPTPGWVAGAAAATLLVVELAFLASPYAASRWLGTPAWVAAAAGGLGLVVGATRLRRAGRWIWVAGALALVDVALARSPLAPLSLGLVQAALGVAAARLAKALPTRGGALAFALTLAPLSFVLLYFRSPLGIGEWEILVPLLAVLAAVPAASGSRPATTSRPRIGAPIAAFLLAASAIAAATPAPIDPPREDVLVVVTWNVHQAFGNRGALDPHIYAEVLERIDADVIFLQESDTARLSSGHVDIVQWLARELRMHAAYGASGAAILSRHPLSDMPRPPDDDWTFEVALDVDGTTLWARSVHLAIARLGNRSAQIDELLADPHSAPHLVAGDLNLCARCRGMAPAAEGLNPQYAALVTRYTDAWVAAGHAVDDPAGGTFRLPNAHRRVDHILVEGLDPIEAYVVRDERARLASDHLPVVATFRLLQAS